MNDTRLQWRQLASVDVVGLHTLFAIIAQCVANTDIVSKS